MTDGAETLYLNSETCQPEMVVHKFRKGAGHTLVLGNLHIRIPHGSTVTENTKKRLLKEALQTLQSVAPTDSATQPVVKVLVGDCNLKAEQAQEVTYLLQPPVPTWRTVWHVHATTF